MKQARLNGFLVMLVVIMFSLVIGNGTLIMANDTDTTTTIKSRATIIEPVPSNIAADVRMKENQATANVLESTTTRMGLVKTWWANTNNWMRIKANDTINDSKWQTALSINLLNQKKNAWYTNDSYYNIFTRNGHTTVVMSNTTWPFVRKTWEQNFPETTAAWTVETATLKKANETESNDPFNDYAFANSIIMPEWANWWVTTATNATVMEQETATAWMANTNTTLRKRHTGHNETNGLFTVNVFAQSRGWANWWVTTHSVNNTTALDDGTCMTTDSGGETINFCRRHITLPSATTSGI
jgi:hypothetical protein